MIWLLPLMFLSGVLGRMGGAHGYDTKYRDIGCPAVFVLFCYLTLGWHPWIYLAVFVLMFGALCTYWDKVFGYDNMWFSGFVVGLTASPLLIIDINLLWILLARTLVLVVGWGCLNKYLPPKVILWRRDVVEEFSRYAITL